MEEKKLTDEEIIKDFSELIGYETGGFDMIPTALNKKILDLIHRLQGENAELKAEKEMREDILEAVTNSTKVLVSSPIGDLPMNINGMKKAVDCIKEQQAEIERLTEENFVLYRDRFTRKELDDISDCRVKKATAELQKQVDELKERAKIDLENERNWGKIQTKQAVKDTAKEILQIITKHPTTYLQMLSEIKERYGVEVE